VDKSQERLAQFLIAGRNPTELFQLVEEAFHSFPSLVLRSVISNRFLTIALGRNDRQHLTSLEALAKLIAVIPFVHDRIGQLRQRRQLAKDRLKDRRIMAGTARQLQGDTGLVIEAADVDFGGKATPRAAQSLCPLPAVFFRAPAAC
jgi:hypothetical protein